MRCESFYLSSSSRRERKPSAVGNPAWAGGSGGAYNLPPATFHGTLKDITSKAIFIEQEDGQPTTIYRNHKTKFLREEKSVDPKTLVIGDKLTLDVAKNPDGSLLAVNVMVSK